MITKTYFPSDEDSVHLRKQEVQLQQTLAFKNHYQHYCIIISIQKISSIHKFIFKIQQSLGSHELKAHGHF